jgi:hypothetical protein
MATLLSLVYDLQNLAQRGRQTDDTNLSDAQVAFHISHYRATLVKQKIDKREELSSILTQNLGKVKIKKVVAAECNCDIIGCSLYKVETTLPKSVYLSYVGSTGGKAFEKTTYNDIYYMQFNKYTAKADRWFMIGEDLYVSSPNHNLGKHINIQGIFEDPQVANTYITCECDNGSECYIGLDFEYPMPTTMWDAVKKFIIDLELRFMLNRPVDNTNNGVDDNAIK